MKEIVKYLRMYYHLERKSDLRRVFIGDLLRTLFFMGGSGLFGSILRGLVYRVFLNYKFPALIGRGFKIINPSNFSAGRNIWFKDHTSLLAAGIMKLGNNCVLCERVTIWSHKSGVIIGDNVAVGIGSYICGSGGKIEIGNEVAIADSVRFYSFNHKYDKIGVPISKQGYSRKGIKIEDNVWIGSGVVVLDGVNIGKNSVVGAGSVVTRDVPPNSLVAGVPAKVVRRLKNKRGT